MHLMYTLDPSGGRLYTLKKANTEGKPTISAHPARFSPDDKYSRHRVTLKKRYKLLPTQVEARKKMLALEAAKAAAKASQVANLAKMNAGAEIGAAR